MSSEPIIPAEPLDPEEIPEPEHEPGPDENEAKTSEEISKERLRKRKWKDYYSANREAILQQRAVYRVQVSSDRNTKNKQAYASFMERVGQIDTSGISDFVDSVSVEVPPAAVLSAFFQMKMWFKIYVPPCYERRIIRIGFLCPWLDTCWLFKSLGGYSPEKVDDGWLWKCRPYWRRWTRNGFMYEKADQKAIDFFRKLSPYSFTTRTVLPLFAEQGLRYELDVDEVERHFERQKDSRLDPLCYSLARCDRVLMCAGIFSAIGVVRVTGRNSRVCVIFRYKEEEYLEFVKRTFPGGSRIYPKNPRKRRRVVRAGGVGEPTGADTVDVNDEQTYSSYELIYKGEPAKKLLDSIQHYIIVKAKKACVFLSGFHIDPTEKRAKIDAIAKQFNV